MKDKRSNADEVGEVVAKSKEKRKLDERSRKWQLTENNPDYTKQQVVERLASIGSTIYCLGCSETGASGTNHVHAFVVFKNAIQLGSLKKVFPRAHFEKCYGTNQNNIDYIKKDDPHPVEVGELPLVVVEDKEDVSSEVVAIILECGFSPVQILKEYPRYCDYVVRNFKNLNEIYLEANNKRRFR